MSMADRSADRDPLDLLAEEFVVRYRRGERPTLAEYVEGYPEQAEQIQELFPALLMMEEIKPAEGNLAPKPPGGRLPPQSLPSPIGRLGDFRILRVLGRGGMGVVYEAIQESLGRHVALKVLPPHGRLDATQLGRFRREARAAAGLHHTNIVPVFAVGEQDGVPYYAMQFIRGQGIDTILDELRRLRHHGAAAGDMPSPRPSRVENSGQPGCNVDGEAVTAAITQGLLSGRFAVSAEHEPDRPANGMTSMVDPTAPAGAATTGGGGIATEDAMAPLSPERSGLITDPGAPYFRAVARIGAQTADALAYAHAQGICHRDIKPSNLLLDAAGVVWVADFGLAKAENREGEGLTHTGDVVGTLRYMAPERFNGWADGRSDVYALGVTLYEMLTLRPAFVESDRLKLIDRISNGAVPRPRSIDPEIPSDLETIVLKAMARETGERYVSARALAEDLERFLADRTILARRSSARERAWRWSRRHKAVAGLLATLVLVLVGGLAGMTALWSHAEHSAVVAGANAIKARQLARTESEARAAAQAQEVTASERAEALAREDYINRVNRASREVQDDNIELAEDLLHGCPPGRRGWEWHYVKRLCHLERLDVETVGSVNAVAYSPDGTWIASGSGLDIMADAGTGESTVDLWDAVTGRRRLTLRGRKGRPYGLAVSPDGHRIAVGSGIGAPKAEAHLSVWNAVTGQIVWSRSEPGFQAMSVAFSPDGKYLAVGYGFYSRDSAGKVKVWDVASGQETMAFPGPGGGVNKVAFHPDGRRLAVAGSGVVEVWDLGARVKVRDLKGHTRWVYGVAFSPDGKWLATGGWDRTVKLWEADTGAERLTIFAHAGFVLDLAFGPDSRLLATTSEDRSMKLWEIPSGRNVASFHGHTHFVQAVAFRPDGREIATGGIEGSVKVWGLRTSRQIVFEDHKGWVGRVAFRHDGRRVLSESARGTGQGTTTKGWDPLTGESDPVLTEVSLDDPRSGFAPGVGFGRTSTSSPDGKHIALISNQSGLGLTARNRKYATSAVVILEAAGARVVHTLIGHTGDVICAVFSPDGRRIATASWDRTIKLWDTATGQDVFTLRGHTAGVVSLAFSPDGNRIASGGIDSTARVWDATPLPAQVLREHESRYQDKLTVLTRSKDVQDDAQRAEALARNGQWGMAAATFGKAAEREPDVVELRFHHHLSLLEAGDLGGYQRAASDMLSRLGKTDSPDACYVAWSCVLAPVAVADRDVPTRLAEVALARSTDTKKRFALTALGAALYRAGRYDEAIRRLMESVQDEGSRGGSAVDWAFLAMAHQRRGDRAEARRCLVTLQAFKPSDASGLSWQVVEIRVLRREAEALVQGSSPAQP
jgi:WD40 repeat protein